MTSNINDKLTEDSWEEKAYDKSLFFNRNMTLNIDPKDWPSQRKYLNWWVVQFNNALLSSKSQIGKRIALNIIGDKDRDILKKDIVQPQNLQIEVLEITAKEFNSFIMGKLKGFKITK